MCGIVGYVGKQPATPILLEGLRRFEYRGYDSAGLAILNNNELELLKKMGKVEEELARLVAERLITGNLGLGHTRWATHGAPSDEIHTPTLTRPAGLPWFTMA